MVRGQFVSHHFTGRVSKWQESLFQSDFNDGWTTPCGVFDATLTRNSVVAMRGSENFCCKTRTGSYYHIIPGAGSSNKRLSPWNMLQDFVHQFLSTALPHPCWQHVVVQVVRRLARRARTVVSEFDQWEGWSDHWPGRVRPMGASQDTDHWLFLLLQGLTSLAEYMRDNSSGNLNLINVLCYTSE